jgi:hypothetical protein
LSVDRAIKPPVASAGGWLTKKGTIDLRVREIIMIGIVAIALIVIAFIILAVRELINLLQD